MLDLAGTHRLEVIELRGRGFGRGFARESSEPDLAALSYLLDCLDRARAQVMTEINRVTVAQHVGQSQRVAASPAEAHPWAATPAVPPCPNCHQPPVWWPPGRWVCPRCNIW
ncbi:MAG TPA: hypothetical protein VGM90_18060 [Kofleriaceae bacterium]